MGVFMGAGVGRFSSGSISRFEGCVPAFIRSVGVYWIGVGYDWELGLGVVTGSFHVRSTRISDEPPQIFPKLGTWVVGVEIY